MQRAAADSRRRPQVENTGQSIENHVLWTPGVLDHVPLLTQSQVPQARLGGSRTRGEFSARYLRRFYERRRADAPATQELTWWDLEQRLKPTPGCFLIAEALPWQESSTSSSFLKGYAHRDRQLVSLLRAVVRSTIREDSEMPAVHAQRVLASSALCFSA